MAADARETTDGCCGDRVMELVGARVAGGRREEKRRGWPAGEGPVSAARWSSSGQGWWRWGRVPVRLRNEDGDGMRTGDGDGMGAMPNVQAWSVGKEGRH